MTDPSDTDPPLSCCTPARGGPVCGEAGQPSPDLPQTNVAVPSDVQIIPGGMALIGTERPELPIDGEGPLRQSRLKPFAIDAAAVTNARFAEFTAATGHVTEAERLGDSFVFAGLLPKGIPPGPGVPEAPWWRMTKGACWHRLTGAGGPNGAPDDHPVVHVSWTDARAFADWAGGRLPSEAEWEHAARGGLGDVRYPWGDTEPDDTGHFPCNIWQGRFPHHNTGLDGYVATAPARSFAPNGYGLFNMVGNVWEWTATPFRVRSLKKSVQRAHAGKAGYRVVKGGSFLCHASYCTRYRIAARSGTSPDSSTSHQGFRVVYDVK